MEQLAPALLGFIHLVLNHGKTPLARARLRQWPPARTTTHPRLAVRRTCHRPTNTPVGFCSRRCFATPGYFIVAYLLSSLNHDLDDRISQRYGVSSTQHHIPVSIIVPKNAKIG